MLIILALTTKYGDSKLHSSGLNRSELALETSGLLNPTFGRIINELQGSVDGQLRAFGSPIKLIMILPYPHPHLHLGWYVL
jgi:hypothetical protein